MKKHLEKLLVVLRNPVYRPYEIWAIRALLVYAGSRLGFDLIHDVSK